MAPVAVAMGPAEALELGEPSTGTLPEQAVLLRLATSTLLTKPLPPAPERAVLLRETRKVL